MNMSSCRQCARTALQAVANKVTCISTKLLTIYSSTGLWMNLLEYSCGTCDDVRRIYLH